MIHRFSNQHPWLQKSFSLLLGVGFLLMVFQWEVLQVGAWASMIQEYRSDSNLQQAVAETFSGDKPCERCKKLTRSQTQTRSENVISSRSNPPPDLSTPETFRLPRIKRRRATYRFITTTSLTTLRVRPPLPPPRFFFC